MHMTHPAKPNVFYHADWGSTAKKRWCARATLGTDGHYTVFAPQRVGDLGSLIEQLRMEAGETPANCLTEDIRGGFPQGD
jgi:hypothetical protein